jgi:hypothetical protein
VTVYAMIAVRAHALKTPVTTQSASSQPASAGAQSKTVPAGAGHPSTAARHPGINGVSAING